MSEKKMELDIAANRNEMKYSRKEMLMRVLWGGVWLLFRLSPRPLFGWRVFLLRLFGARIGKHVHIYNSAHIYMPWNLEVGDWSAIGEDCLVYNLGQVVIGEKTTISHRVHLCAGTHDYTDAALPLLKPDIVIEDMVWLCADCFIGPGVTVEEGAVVGARAVVTGDVEAWHVVAGNPARTVKMRNLEE